MKYRSYLAALPLTYCALAALPAAAQAPAQADTAAQADSGALLEDIIVTARRRDESTLNTPVAITAISAATLDNYQVRSVLDMGKLVPQLLVGTQVSGSASSIYLRGVGSSTLSAGFSQSVSMNLNGISLSRGRELLLTQYDLDHVEVLKGPQALFFGKNGDGGVISLVTAKPTDSFQAKIATGYEFNGGEAFGEGMISGPLSETLTGRFAIRASRMDRGYFPNDAQAITSNGILFPGPKHKRAGQAESVSGRATLKFDPSADFSAVLMGGITKYKDSGASAYLDTICSSGRTTPLPTAGVLDPYTRCGADARVSRGSLPEIYMSLPLARDGDPYSRYTSHIVSLDANWDIGGAKLSSVTAYYDMNQTSLDPFSGQAAPGAVFVGQQHDYRQFSQELRLATQLEGPLNAVVGGYYEDSRYKLRSANQVFALPRDPATGYYMSFDRFGGFDANAMSLFGELTYNITDQLILAGGARWTHETKDSFLDQRYTNPAIIASFPQRRYDDKFKDSNVSPQVILTYKPDARSTFYAAYKQGYKSGGLNISATVLASTILRQLQFGSENAKGFEGGAKLLLADGRVRIDGNVYRYDYNNLQVNVYDPATLALSVGNAGKLRTTGAELSIDFAPSRAVTFRAAGGYNRAKFFNYVGQCFTGQTIAEGCNLNRNPTTGVFASQNYGGRTGPRAPKFSGRAGATYNVPVMDTWKLGFNADVTYSSSYNYTDELYPDAIQKAFARFDAGVSLSGGDGLKISLTGRNLTNRHVVVAANARSNQGGGTGTATGVRPDLNGAIDAPRRVYLEVSKTF